MKLSREVSEEKINYAIKETKNFRYFNIRETGNYTLNLRLLKITEHYWRSLKTIEGYWKILKIIKDNWRVLKITKAYWSLLKTIEDYWRILKINEDYWEDYSKDYYED